jgi:hypothetical protein
MSRFWAKGLKLNRKSATKIVVIFVIVLGVEQAPNLLVNIGSA